MLPVNSGQEKKNDKQICLGCEILSSLRLIKDPMMRESNAMKDKGEH